MAFQLVQKFHFEGVDYSYDRKGDVLDVSFGPPSPAIALQVEDWLAIRVGLQPPPFLQGITIAGFKRIFEKLNRYIAREIPQRMKRLSTASVEISYDDSTDTLIMRVREQAPGRRRRVKERHPCDTHSASVFEQLSQAAVEGSPIAGDRSLRNVYVEKSLPSKDLVGIKILEYTKCGPAALEAIFGAIIDTVFESNAEHNENAHLLTKALIERFDWRKLATSTA
jgi:hypothetical protein